MAGNNIRNVVVLGHQGSGKTTLVESLYSTATGKDKGYIEKGTTVSDYLPEEKDKLSSVRMSIVPLEYQNYKINLIDIPGNDDFIGEAIAAAGVVKGAILVLDATSGVQVENPASTASSLRYPPPRKCPCWRKTPYWPATRFSSNLTLLPAKRA